MTDDGDCARRGPARYLFRAIEGDAIGPAAELARAGLQALSWGYLGAVNAIALAHRAGLRRRQQASVPIVSVGNLTVGGTGKSTTAATLAEWLRDAGRRPAVLSRGYGARRGGPPLPPQPWGGKGGPADVSVRVVSDGERVLLSPDDGGDEPVMLARRLSGVPVLIGRRRPLAARAAVSRFGADVCILDDGFQVWNLAKNLEIVLLDGERAFDNGYVLPRGLLREPPQHLARADVVLLMEPPPCPTWAGDSPPALRALRGRVRDLAPRALLVEARRVPSRLWDLADGRDSEIEALSGAKVLALSAIGNPAGFEGLLRELGAEVYAMRLPDHHRYGEADLEQILTAARRSGASCIVTTDKDAVKLATLCCAAHEPGPLRKASRRGRGLLPWRRALTPGWGIRGGAADDPAEGGAPAGRMGAAPEIAGFLAERGAPPLRVLSIRLQFLAGEEALRERVLALAGRVPNA